MTMLLKKLAALLFLLTITFEVNAFNVRAVDGLWGIDSKQSLAVGRAINLNGIPVAIKQHVVPDVAFMQRVRLQFDELSMKMQWQP